MDRVFLLIAQKLQKIAKLKLTLQNSFDKQTNIEYQNRM